MVVTSKVLGLALLSALSLAAPFEDSSIAARNADAIAEALLEFDDLEIRDAEAEADPEAEADAEAEAEAEAEAFELEEGNLFERDAFEDFGDFAVEVCVDLYADDFGQTNMHQGPRC